MAIEFPASPTLNDTFTEGSITYTYDGAKWIGLGVTPADRLLEGSNKLEIDGSNNLVWTGNNVGIGIDSPLQTSAGRTVLNINGTNNALLNFSHGETLSGFIYGANDEFRLEADGTRPLVFRTAGGTALTINSSGQLISNGRIFINNTNGGFDYNTTADTLEVLTTNGGTHSEFNANAFVPSGSKNLGASGSRWNTVYANTFNVATGIDFSSNSNAAGMTSEVLDDYEEGAWTPTLLFGSGSTGMSYGMREGHYVKIGRQVIAQYRIELINKGSSTGGMTISTPFAVDNQFSSTGIDGNSIVVYTSGMSSSQVGNSHVSGYCEGGTSLSYYTARLSTGSAATLNNGDLENNFSISGTMMFYNA